MGLRRRWSRNPAGRILHEWWAADWGFDWFYDRVFVRPIVWLARVNARDVVDLANKVLAGTCGVLYRDLSRTENGRVRWYAAGIAAGTALFLAIVLFV